MNPISFCLDNPFFPPLNVSDVTAAQWPSTVKVNDCIQSLASEDIRKKISYGNAKTLLNI